MFDCMSPSDFADNEFGAQKVTGMLASLKYGGVALSMSVWRICFNDDLTLAALPFGSMLGARPLALARACRLAGGLCDGQSGAGPA